MAGKSVYAANLVLDTLLRDSGPSYMAIYTAAPSDAGGGTEVSGGNYSRAAITFGLAVAGASTNSADVNLPTPSESWGACSYFGIHDDPTAGNLLYWGALAQTETPLSGNVVKFPIGTIIVTED